MKRSTFMLLAALLAAFFGLNMLFMPDKMIHQITVATDASAMHVLQYAGCMLTAIAVINFLSRNDMGSVSLRAVMLGNIVIHVVGLAVDGYHYSIGFINAQGIAMGTIVHVGLTAGFAYYLMKMGK